MATDFTHGLMPDISMSTDKSGLVTLHQHVVKEALATDQIGMARVQYSLTRKLLQLKGDQSMCSSKGGTSLCEIAPACNKRGTRYRRQIDFARHAICIHMPAAQKLPIIVCGSKGVLLIRTGVVCKPKPAQQ